MRLLILLILAFVLAGCAAQTIPSEDVTQTSATVYAQVGTTVDEGGVAWFEYREVGASSWTKDVEVSFRGAASPGSQFGRTLTGLTPGTTYEYRLCAYLLPSHEANCADSGGGTAGNWDTFTTASAPPPTTTTTTTTTTPPPGSTCFTSPGSCGFPDPAYGNVGVPAGTTLTNSGSIEVNTPGTVIDGLNVSGSITVNADNVTIRNTKVTATSGCSGSTCGNSLIRISGAHDVTVSHVELTSAPGLGGTEHAIRNTHGGTLRADHLYQHGHVDALCHCGVPGGGSATITDSYSVIDLNIPGDHLENIYVEDKTLTVIHNTFINLQPQTANIFMDSGGDNHLTARNNLFAGGGFTMYVCPKNGCSTASAIVTDNMFARCDHGNEIPQDGGLWVCPNGADDYGLFPRSGSFGSSANMPPNTTWARNVWTDGAPVP